MPTENKCRLCGKLNPATLLYCAECGAKLSGATSRPTTIPPTPPERNATPAPGNAPSSPQERSRRAWKMVFIPATLLFSLFGVALFWTIRTNGPAPYKSTFVAPPSLSGTNFVVTRREDFPRHLDLTVAVAPSATKSDLQSISSNVVAQERPSKRVQIWFETNDGSRYGKNVGSYDSEDGTVFTNADFSSSTPQVWPSPTAPPNSTLRPLDGSRPATSGTERTGAVCNDGTTSEATGRGACSHHGGVNYWLYR